MGKIQVAGFHWVPHVAYQGKNIGRRLRIDPGADKLRCKLIAIAYRRSKVLRESALGRLGYDLR